MLNEAAATGSPHIVMVSSIHELDRRSWNSLVGPDDFYQSHEWLANVERDGTAMCRYLISYRYDRLVGALPLYRVDFEGSPLYRRERLCELLGMEGDYLLAGSRRGYRSSLLIASDLAPRIADGVVCGLLNAALVMAAEEERAGVVIPFLPTSAVERIGRFMPIVATFDSAEAIVLGVGGGIEAYLDTLSAKRRHTARKEMARFAAAGWHTASERLADCVSDVARLVTLVELRHGKDTPEILFRRLFRRQAEAVDHRAVVFTCRDELGRMAACSVNYIWGGTLYNRSIGLDSALLKDSFEYFNILVYLAVVYASEHQLGRLHLSIEPSSAKLQRGAVLNPLWTTVVRHPAPRDRPGVSVVNPDAMNRWAKPLRPFTHAFAAEHWVTPGPGIDG